MSGGRIRLDGKSVRAESQARRWNRESGNTINGKGRYETKIVKREPAKPGARWRIINWEERNARRLRNMGQLDPARHTTP